jgi:anaerobic selenocysteine-containing dehydrogenase
MATTEDWRPTACILCECNCGLEVRLGGEDGRHLVRLRGDAATRRRAATRARSRTASTTTSTGAIA